MSQTTTQVNFRFPTILKQQAMHKAEDMGINLNHLMKMFLLQFVQKDTVQVQYSFDFDGIFDAGIQDFFIKKSTHKKLEKMTELLTAQGVIL